MGTKKKGEKRGVFVYCPNKLYACSKILNINTNVVIPCLKINIHEPPKYLTCGF